jgi:hypothetical protein
MKKILLITASCMALHTSHAFGMEAPDKQLLIHSSQRPTASIPELREYIHKALKKEGVGEAISTFDDFVESLQNIIFSKTAKTVQQKQDQNQAFSQLKTNYVKSVHCFYTSFNEHLIEEAKVPFPMDIPDEAVHVDGYLERYPFHEPYYKTFQTLSNQFLSIRERCLSVALTSEFETIRDTEESAYQVFLFKNQDEYIPIPLTTKPLCSSMSVLYGPQLVPQKQFTFRHETLIEESGIILSPFDKFLKLTMQHGKKAEYPFTSSSQTWRVDYDYDIPLMTLLKNQFGKEISEQMHFIALPTTQEESDILELLFLEEINESKQEGSVLSQKFLAYIKEDTIDLNAKIQELEAQVLNASVTAILENATQKPQPQKKKKTQPKQNKKQPKKNNKGGQSQQKNQPSSKQVLELEKKKEAKELLEKVKQEGRVKFREILGILNKIRSATDDKAFSKFATIGRKGSHINFHLEDGKGLTLVQKHGKEDVTYPAKQVNYFSRQLINSLFFSEK